MGNKRILRALAFFCVYFFAVATALAQERTITGTISDETGQPISGATIAAKGQPAVNAVSKTDGSFEIKLPAAVRALVVSHVGMTTKTVNLDGRTQMIISMEMSPNSMEEVVVVGYGQSKKGDLTAAQTQVTAKQIEKTINTTLEQALQGRAAGVYITQNSGQPGGGMSVNIRGISSLSRTQPLYVVDGVQAQVNEDVAFGNSSTNNPLAHINPNDIEDVQILQGPSATAIYGSRGTNGVILITTKRGKAGGVKINYGYQYNLQTPPKHLDVMNLPQYAQMVKEYHSIAGGTTPEEFEDPTLLGPGTDWQRELFNNAAMQKHQINFSGGNNNTTYYLSGENLNQEGVALGSGFKRYGLRLNLDNKPREWATLGINLNASQTNEVLTTTNYGDAASPLIANALRLTPQIPVTNLDGSWGGSDPINGAGQFAPVNPVALANLINNTSKRRQMQGGINLAVRPVDGLTLRTSAYGSFGDGVTTYYNPTYRISQWHYNLNATLSNGTYTSWYWNWLQQIEYAKKFGKHNFTIMASHEAQESSYKSITVGRGGFLTNDVFDVDAGDPTSATNSGGTYPWAIESYLGRFTYNYDNRYLLTATFRRDGSALFGEDKRWGNFPSVSVAWRMSQEKWWNADAINELKFRFETGLTGNPGTSAGIYSRLNTGATPWGTGFLPAELKNSLLQWEETNSINVGINVGILNNRFTIEADYYERQISNLLMQASVPWYQGAGNVPGSVSPPWVNTGTMDTKGWNLTLTSSNIIRGELRWETNLNFSAFKSKVARLNNDRLFIPRTSWWMNNWTQWAHVGMDPWLFRGYVFEGLYESVADAEESARPVDNNGNLRPVDPNTGIWVGDVKYKDINGDGKIDVNDETFIGNPWPKLTAGFTNTFSYKGFDLSFLFTGTFGNDIYNFIRGVNLNPNNVNLSRNFLIEAGDYARIADDGTGKIVIQNAGTRVARIANNQIASENNYGKNSSRFVEDGSYIRLKNVSLGYSIPPRLLGYTKVIKELRIIIGAQNLVTWTNYTGYDPEVGAYIGTGASGGGGGNQAIGVDFGRYPLSPMYTASINVNF
jgi:TonB-dependent starch-binding outer membrane protein SusC